MEETQQDIQEGTRVLLVGKHPWTGHSGYVAGEFKDFAGRLFKRVRLDNGMSPGAQLKHIQVIDE